jgi:hypothetical protein
MVHYEGISSQKKLVVPKGNYIIDDKNIKALYEQYIERGIRWYEFDEWIKLYNIKKVKKK